MAKERTKRGSITQRWIFGNLLWIVIFLAVAGFAVVSLVRQSNYNSVLQSIQYRVDSAIEKLPVHTLPASERAAQLRLYVEDFLEKDKFEMMLINDRGNVTVTSSGFAPMQVSRTQDYLTALASSDGYGSYIGYSQSGEHIAAVTQLLPSAVGETVAIRFVTSLTGVDGSIYVVMLWTVAGALIILMVAALSGLYFIKSIVNPIGEISDSANDIASGNFNVRLSVDRNDELGQLSSQINEMAQGLSQTERMKNDFISSVSHELRTPLTSIKGWGETVSAIGTKDEETFQKGMSIILSETDRLSLMVEELLDFSRLQSGRLQLQTEPVDLYAEVMDAVMTIEQRAKNAGITISLTECRTAVPIMGDKMRLRQVFGNILENAVKYSDKGSSVEVEVKTEGEHAIVTVTDHGKGIPSDEIPLVTRRYYKASNSVTGSGIGLAVVSELMQAHGGSIDIRSELGQGTAIELKFELYGIRETEYEQKKLF